MPAARSHNACQRCRQNAPTLPCVSAKLKLFPVQAWETSFVCETEVFSSTWTAELLFVCQRVWRHRLMLPVGACARTGSGRIRFSIVECLTSLSILKSRTNADFTRVLHNKSSCLTEPRVSAQKRKFINIAYYAPKPMLPSGLQNSFAFQIQALARLGTSVPYV